MASLLQTDWESDMNSAQFIELLLQSLEHEKGGVLVYETALKCVINEDLQEEWEKYLEETRNHVQVLTEVCVTIGLPRCPPLAALSFTSWVDPWSLRWKRRWPPDPRKPRNWSRVSVS